MFAQNKTLSVVVSSIALLLMVFTIVVGFQSVFGWGAFARANGPTEAPVAPAMPSDSPAIRPSGNTYVVDANVSATVSKAKQLALLMARNNYGRVEGVTFDVVTVGFPSKTCPEGQGYAQVDVTLPAVATKSGRAEHELLMCDLTQDGQCEPMSEFRKSHQYNSDWYRGQYTCDPRLKIANDFNGTPLEAQVQQ